jgi:transposase
MMGRQEQGQGQFLYNFRLEEHVPGDHLVRRIDAVLDTSWVHRELAAFYSHTGRPWVDPELMIRMLIVGYVFAVRSERRLCEEVQVNLAYRWFCGLGIEDRVPNHSVFSRARHERFRDAEAFRLVFGRVVGACLAAGLVGAESFSIDASLIKADVNKAKRVAGDGPIDWPGRDEASRAVREYLDVLDEAARSDDERGGGDGGGSGHGRGKPAKAVSLTDPQAAWVGRKGMDPFFAYDANYLIDNKAGIIVDAEGTRANRSEEIAATEAMVERVERRFELTPNRLAGDTVYGAARTLTWLMDKGIEPHIPVWDKSRRDDGTFSRTDFVYDGEANLYTCPGGKVLRTTGKVHEGRTRLYRARKADCDGCALKRRCCPKAPSRKVPRDIHEATRDRVRALANTPAFEQSRRERKKVEMAFAHMKRILKLDRLRLRGLTGAKFEVLLAAIALNLRKLATYAGRSPPAPAPCTA